MEVQRYFGAVNIDGKLYRVKTTVKKVKLSKVETSNQQYTFEVQEMELIEKRPAPQGMGGIENANSPTNPINSIDAANFLKGVKKSNTSELILDVSVVVDENGEPLDSRHRRVGGYFAKTSSDAGVGVWIFFLRKLKGLQRIAFLLLFLFIILLG